MRLDASPLHSVWSDDSVKVAVSFQDVLRRRLADSLSSYGKFQLESESGSVLHSSFNGVLGSSVDFELDPVAISDFLGHYAFFGSHTLLKQVRRTDFHVANELGETSQLVRIPKHGQEPVPAHEVASRLLELMLQETERRIHGCEHIGLLLSGGMDSRIVAAVLRHLQQRGNGFQVTCFTWGDPATRDPVYAQRIASRYGWCFEHFSIGPELLWENVNTVAANGCFHSALHLHAMVPVGARAAELGVQLMLAGSYGDSVGRAEYSRVHVSKLKPIERRIRNWYGLMEPSIYEECRPQTLLEIQRCRDLYGASDGPLIRELDLQLHYMRNMLGSAMSVIDAQVPLAQAFTSREVVEYMWGLAPECRTDEIYFQVLSELEPELLEIPWARTGRPYLRPGEEPDSLVASFHDYPGWTRQLLGRIRKLIFSGSIERTGVFDMGAVHELVKAFDRFAFIRAGRVLELFVWLASLAIFLERLDLPPVNREKARNSLHVKGRLDLGLTIARQYQLFGGKSGRGP